MSAVTGLAFALLFFSNRDLYEKEDYKELARKTFLEHEKFYHPIAVENIRRDLGLESKKSGK